MTKCNICNEEHEPDVESVVTLILCKNCLNKYKKTKGEKIK